MNKRRTSKAFRVRATMTLLLLLLTSTTAWAADGVKYIDADGQEKTQNGVTIINDNTPITLGTTDATTWYIMTGEINYESTVSLMGDVHIILADGAQIEINAYNGVSSSEDSYNGIYATGSLSIYGQEAGTGTLTINSDKITKPGNGIFAENGGITINGGILNISANQYGISTYKGENSSSICDITITGGRITVTATNGIDADGNITLGCRKGTDYIFASSYSNNVIIAGQTLIDGMNAYNNGTINDPSVLSSKILAPDLFGISNGNTGTSSNPYAISTGDGLQLLATYVNNGYVFSGKFFTLNDDIAFNSSTENNFTPIGGKFGKVYYSFCGSFDGDGHTISGIDIDIDDNDYAGIFGYLESGASISNVSLVNASIRGNKFIGGIVGKNEGGSISNCLVTNTTILGSQYTGVIAGLNTSEGILDHNYYSGCTFAGTSNVYNVGCGADGTPSDITTLTISETEYLDGAVGYLSETAESNPTLTKGQVVYFFRDFTADVYSTIILPFSYTPNDEGTFYTFTDIQKENDSYVATMTEVSSGSSLTENMPYLFKPKETKRLLFKGTAPTGGIISAGEAESGNWKFKGTYKKLTYGTAPFSDPVYGFAAKAKGDVIAGEFVMAAEGASIPAMRCFLKYNTTSTRGETEELPGRIAVKLVGDPTSIGTLNARTGEVTFDGWYSLDGQRFNTKPTKKGLYIYKGIKVTIK